MAVFYMNSVKPNGKDASVLSEDNEFSHNGVDPFMNIHKDGSFSDTIEEAVPPQVKSEKDVEPKFPQKARPPQVKSEKDVEPKFPQSGPPPIKQEEQTLTEDIDPAMVMNMISSAGDWAAGGGMVSVGGEMIPKNLMKIIMGVVPSAVLTGFIATYWSDIKAKLGLNKEKNIQ